MVTVCKNRNRVQVMISFSLFVSLFSILSLLTNFATSSNEVIVSSLTDIEILLGEKTVANFEIRNESTIPVQNISLIFLPSIYLDYPNRIPFLNGTAHLPITGILPVSRIIIEAINCTDGISNKCPLNIDEAFIRVSVIRSKYLSILSQIVGWLYFFAWSISFYPQIWLNFKRKSVVGLNFDFLSLNLVGFGAYSLFNLLMYYNEHVQKIYRLENPHSPPPVLANDVVFAVHAFFACFVTVVQCLMFERENQKVSNKCILLIIALFIFGIVSACATVLNKISILAFVTSLSYIKMVVTCCKYFPQAYFNYIRKSTIGWSIGNILLDFTGGSLDIAQMVLQAVNVNDWSAFYANPVKFGLGLVSIIFDIFFILQHYVFYRNSEVPHNEYEGIDNLGTGPSISPTNEEEDYGSNDASVQPIVVYD